ncbi:protein of unknown function [Prevotella sp. khp1]|uniref:DUF4842 domain-containing protein n=1 Tax=Prevotellaceae TaxID=171552 RepID=UPI0008904BE4|nr:MULTISPECIES: DUF4842 domain-containing protein [Prevotellaceae]QVJ80716.1 DUF4842 domain-containing protein [Xylanibacter ruminicola]SDQ15441.1 protein of unknown function [Prevotella sp. khp1]
MKKLLSLAVLGLVLSGCVKGFEGMEPEPNPDPEQGQGVTDEEIKNHAEEILGFTIPDNQDWISTESGTVTINVTSAVTKVAVMALVAQTDEDGETYNSMTKLNEAEIKDKSSISLNYDVPQKNEGLYVAFYTEKGCYYKKVEGNSVTFDQVAKTRAVTRTVSAPSGTFAIGKIESSFAAERGWIPDEKLYMLSDEDYNRMQIPVDPYNAEYNALVRDLVFAYLPNKAYNNLDKVKAAGYTDDNAYRVTTGEDGPIVISPIYKNDGGYEEVINSDLYYYYFKPADLENAADKVAFLQSLPKFKLIPFGNHFVGDKNDVVEKTISYACLYFGDSKTPALETKGTFKFPAGYKIGFMVRAKTTDENKKKQGELYFDGRLNVDINNYDKTNFTSSFKKKNLPLDSPRATWLKINDRSIMCWESGTDTDFNDILLEVEGSVEPIYTAHEFEYNTYTFCFEDTQKGDYDLNDVVIKAKRINETTVEYSLEACGAYDELCVRNVNAGVIQDNVEIHSLFGVDAKQFVNTESGAEKHAAITARKTVSESFSFLDEINQPYVYDVTTKHTVKLSLKGQDPHGIMIPFDFKYPVEKVCIKDAYNEFNNWGKNPVNSTNWYTKPVTGKVIE